MPETPIDTVVHVESGNKNIPQQIHDVNTEKGTPAGGYLQIIDPTWRAAAPKAGVDLKQYPTALSAPKHVQVQVASVIPVNQWGPNTVAALKAKYPGINVNGTLGDAQLQFAGGAAAAPAPTTPSGRTSPAQDFLAAQKSGNFGAMLAALNKGTDDQSNKGSVLSGLSDTLNQGRPAAPTPSPAMLPQVARPPDTSGPSSQLLGQIAEQQAKPLSWSSTPFGSNAGPQAPGTTLNSLMYG
jgi:hypothetical protein